MVVEVVVVAGGRAGGAERVGGWKEKNRSNKVAETNARIGRTAARAGE